jgi:uncharacterized protein (DUF2147 family)
MTHIVRWIPVALLLACLLPAQGSRAQGADASPAGVWANEGETSHIKIEDCAGKLCGSIVWLKEPLDGKGNEKADKENPDATLKSRKLLGLKLLEGFTQKEGETKVWRGGTIYNPHDGKTYSCTLTLQDARTLGVRGYVGVPMFGKSQTWTRVE